MKFSDIPCICCGDTIHSMSPHIPMDDAIDTDRDIIEMSMWGNGEVSRVEFGFGSKLDGSVFYIGLCDGCAETKANGGEIYYSHDYMDVRNIDSEGAKIWKAGMTSKMREIEINKIIK